MLKFYKIISRVFNKLQGKTVLSTLTLFSFLCVGHVHSQEPETVAFFHLESFIAGHPLPQSIKIRGFLHKTSDHRWVLAAEPNLKSCCVGSHANRSRQLLISGCVEVSQDCRFPVTVQGILKMDPEGDFPLIMDETSLFY